MGVALKFRFDIVHPSAARQFSKAAMYNSRTL